MSIFKRALEALIGKKELQEQINQLKKEAITNQQLIQAVQSIEAQKKPCYNKVIYNVNTQSVTVIDCNGDNFSGYVETDVIEKLKTATTEEIIALLTPPKEEKTEENSIEKEEKEIVSNFLDIFDGVDDFEVAGNSVYFLGVKSVEIPSLIVSRFIQLIEKHRDPVDEQIQTGYLVEDEEYQSLKAFTLKLLLNPLKESRDHALEFVRNFDIKLTNTGNMIMYRRIVAKGDKNKELVEFVSKQYLKVKSWKKSPKNYEVFDDNGLVITQGDKRHDYNNHQGNLADLYNNLSEFKENRYTDDYTRTYDIRIGATYKIREEDIDLNKNGSCGGALHVADGKMFDYSGFGNTPVVCIVSPQHIYKMDSGCSGKIGVRQMFIAAVTSQDENGNYEDIDSQDLVNFDELYHNESLQQLQEALRTKSLESTSVSTAISGVSLKDIESISNILKSRTITF